MVGANVPLLINKAVDVLLDVVEIFGISRALVHFFQGFQQKSLLVIPSGRFAQFDRNRIAMGVHDAGRHAFGIVLAM